YGIMAKGGFDVIVGNPPYVEYAKVRSSYSIRGFTTLGCGNLYAFVLERSQQLAGGKGRIGLIVPLSLVCTDRMIAARSILGGRVVWIAGFHIRPSSIFEGVAQRMAILLQDTTTRSRSVLYSGGYRRWAHPEREHLLALTRFTRTALPEDAPITKI